MKKCNKCKLLKSLDNFPKRKSSLDGYRNECKGCRCEYLRNYHKNPPVKEVLPEGQKRCSKCKKLLELACFHKYKRSPDGHKARCKDCRNADNKQHMEQNPEYYKAWQADNKEHLRETGVAYREKNKEILSIKSKKYAEKNKEKIRAYKKEWYEKNRSKVKAGKRRRRARQAACEENYTERDERVTLKVFGNKCFNCGSKYRLHIDHHRPLIKGYALSLDNAVVLCEYCNKSKGAKNPEDFYGIGRCLELDKVLANISLNKGDSKCQKKKC